jgi:ribosome biogenesis GTPase / thiamine phosphate phosphatase
MTETTTLRALGWSQHFQAQLELDEIAAAEPLRVAAVHRNGADAIGTGGPRRVAATGSLTPDMLAVGDWLLAESATWRPIRRLERRSLIRRRAAGTGRAEQAIAANVDTLFVVSSCNADFNPARLERYLALARASEVMPVIVLSKADTCDDAEAYAADARRLGRDLVVEALDAREPSQVARLALWCGPGQTVALAGTSGTGKSTLVITLSGAGQATQGIREDDARGRHTTTARSLHRLPTGGWLIDTPGMRELKLTDAAEGVAAVFADIGELAAGCRFADCAHEAEPGCAVQAAIAEGRLEAARLARWRKLLREDAHNSASIAEARARGKAFGRMARAVVAEKEGRKGW